MKRHHHDLATKLARLFEREASLGDIFELYSYSHKLTDDAGNYENG